MTIVERRSASAIRASLDHPIIDADAHLVEYLPALISLSPGRGHRAQRSPLDGVDEFPPQAGYPRLSSTTAFGS